MRGSGILMPIASLPSKYGIGLFSKEAYQFVDWLEKAGQRYWQLLPLGPTGYGDSPYQSFSTFAVNPYFIDLDQLLKEGYITKEECLLLEVEDHSQITYEPIFYNRREIFKKAYERFARTIDVEYETFCKAQSFWLDDYALYMAIKEKFGYQSIKDWGEDIRLRKEGAMDRYQQELAEEVACYKFQQYKAYTQWLQLKEYANGKGIEIIGDLPIYVAYDSADTWAHPKLFQLDGALTPKAVAGCPPDAFATDGQLWGNPLYEWEYHQRTDYEWWTARMKQCFLLYNVVRLDHFRGFDEYYSIPYGQETARDGIWKKGPGLPFFKRLEEKLGGMKIIAEDLGFLTESVKQLVVDTGYPSMKILQFAFDSREAGDYLPCNYDKNCVVYTGTHDNDTILGWYETVSKDDLDYAREYMNLGDLKREEIPWEFIRLAMGSVANLCIFPIQDYLGLGSEARINVPSTLGNNWCWRLNGERLTQELAEKIRRLTKVFARSYNVSI